MGRIGLENLQKRPGEEAVRTGVRIYFRGSLKILGRREHQHAGSFGIGERPAGSIEIGRVLHIAAIGLDVARFSPAVPVATSDGPAVTTIENGGEYDAFGKTSAEEQTSELQSH